MIARLIGTHEKEMSALDRNKLALTAYSVGKPQATVVKSDQQSYLWTDSQ